jgi:hypothetical protein
MPISILTSENHKALRVSPATDYSELANISYLPVVVQEFAPASAEFPVVFLKHADTGQYRAVALFGPAGGHNVFVRDGKWLAEYVPAIVRQAPFKLAATGPEGEFAVAIDTDSPLVSETDGEALFTEDGKPSEFLDQRGKALVSYGEHLQLTEAFVQLLVDEGLIREQKLTYRSGEETGSIGGIHVVDEQKLNTLPQETYITLRDRGFIGVIYAHLLSLNMIRRMAALSMERAAA